MKHKKITVILVLLPLLLLILGGGLWWHKHPNSATATTEGGEPGAEVVSALVKTQKIEQQTLDTQLLAFGEVASAKILSLSFPQAGQLTSLPVLPGQQVHRGETLAMLISDPTAQTTYVQATTAANFAHAELQREEELFGLKLLTQTQLDTARKQVQDADSMLASQKKLGGATEAATLTAPEEGVVLALTAAQGDRLAAGVSVLQLGDTRSLRIALGIEPGQRHLLRTGMKVTLSTVQNPTQTINAKINEVQHVIDSKTQLINAIVIVPASTAESIVAGMRVQGIIHLGQQQAWIAPRQAVLTDDKGAYIFQVAEGKAHRVEVTKVSESPTQIGFEGDLDPKLPLVVLGNYELEEAMAVRESGK